MGKKILTKYVLFFQVPLRFSRADMISFGLRAGKGSGMNHFQAEAVRNPMLDGPASHPLMLNEFPGGT